MSEIKPNPEELPVPPSDEATRLIRDLVVKTNSALTSYRLAIRGNSQNLVACHKTMQKHAQVLIELRDGLEKLESLNAGHADSIASHAKSLANYGEAISKLLAHCFPEEAELAKKEPVN